MTSRADWRTLSLTPPSRGLHWQRPPPEPASIGEGPPWTRPQHLAPLIGSPYFRLCALPAAPERRSLVGRVLEGRRRPTPALCFVGDLGPARSFLLVPAPSPPIPLAESAVEDGPSQDRKANPAPVGGTQAAHQPRASRSRSPRVQGLHLRPSVLWSSVPCGTQRRCQCWSPTSAEELVSQEPLVFVSPQN